MASWVSTYRIPFGFAERRVALRPTSGGAGRPHAGSLSGDTRRQSITLAIGSANVHHRTLRCQVEVLVQMSRQFLSSNLVPDKVDLDFLADMWSQIALTDDDEYSLEALNLVFNKRIDRVAVISHTDVRSMRFKRQILVRTQSSHRPVPLLGLGDGATRFFGTSIALANGKNGFVVIDEVEN